MQKKWAISTIHDYFLGIVLLAIISTINITYAADIFVKPSISYEFYNTLSGESDSVDKLLALDNQVIAAKFKRCKSGSTYVDCCDVTNAPFDPGSTGSSPLPEYYYNVGESDGTYYSKPSLTSPEITSVCHNTGHTVHVMQWCSEGFVQSTVNGSQVCVWKEPESNACPTGNPINTGTGIKYEHEIDFSTDEGALSVERFYISQYKGWTFDEAPRLAIVDAGKEIDFPDSYRYHVLSRDFVDTYYDANGNYAPTYIKKYLPLMLINPTSQRTAYLWLGNHSYRFIDNGSGFVSDDQSGRRISIEAFTSSTMPNVKWKVTTDNQDIHYFLMDGTATRTEFSKGGAVDYDYHNGKLMHKTDHMFRQLSYNYDSENRLIAVTLPDASTIIYTYASNDKNDANFHFLQRVQWSNGENINYQYNETGNYSGANTGTIMLTGKMDAYGQRIGTYKYQGSKAVSTERFNGIEKRELLFSAYATTVKNALGNSRTYNFYVPNDQQTFLNGTSQPAGSGCSASTKNITYFTGTDVKQSETDFNGNITQYVYDMDRRLETVRVEGIASGTTTDYTAAAIALPAGVQKITTQWHTHYRKPIKKAKPGLITTFIYNGDADPFNSNQIAHCSPSTQALLCHEVQQATTDNNGAAGFSAALDTTLSKRDVLYTYNNRGQLLTRAGNVHSEINEIREYFEANTSDAHIGDVKSITNSLGHKIQFTRYDSNGKIVRAFDTNGIEMLYTYDGRGRLASYSIGGSLTTHAYDLNGNRTKTVLPNGIEVNYTYDPAKRLVSVNNALGDKIAYEYDLESNLRFERVTNASGTLTFMKEHIYDALNREQKQIDTKNQSTTFLYDPNGNSTGIVDPNNHGTTQAFDTLDQLKTVTDALSSTTNYTYDNQGNLTQVKDVRNNSTTYAYNAFGELTSQTSPDTGTTTFTYDDAGNRLSATDARNIVVNYAYDALNRLTSITYPATPADNITYTYDSTANGSYGIGRLASISSGTSNNLSRMDYVYNHLGLITKKFTQIGSTLNTTQYSYDIAGNLTGITYPSGRIVTYTRDSAGRIQTIKTKQNASATEQTLISNQTWLPFGPASGYTYGNGLTHTLSYDSDYRLTSIQVGGVLSRGYSYDPADNITGITNPVTISKNQTFGYDPLNRLTSATGIYGSLGYTYDAVGNRLTETSAAQATPTTVTTNSYSYPSTSNRLTSISKKTGSSASSTRSFAYDNNGNRIQGTQEDGSNQTYTYNNANRLTTVKVGSNLVGTYAYNPLGQRISKTVTNTANNGQELYHYDEAGQLIAVTDNNTNTKREYIYNGNQLVGFVNVASATNSSASSSTTTSSASTSKSSSSVTTTSAASSSKSSSSSSSSSSTASAVTTYLATNQATLQNAVLATTYSGYSGSWGYIQFNGEGQASWPMAVTNTDAYTLKFSYALATATRSMDLYIDGVKQTQLKFNTTGAWTAWKTIVVTQNLSTGNHTLLLKTTGASGPNLDRIAVTNVIASAASTSAAASTSTATSSATSSSKSSSSAITSSATSSSKASSTSSSSSKSSSSRSVNGTSIATLYYVHTDHNGTPQVVTAQNQSVVWMADYQPFGKLQPGQTNSIELYSRFPGQYLDTETGLYYNWFRDYDASIGRYIESDPIGLKGGINTYAYVMGNPLKGIDPMGLTGRGFPNANTVGNKNDKSPCDCDPGNSSGGGLSAQGALQGAIHVGPIGVSASAGAAAGAGTSGSGGCFFVQMCMRVGPGAFLAAGGAFSAAGYSGALSQSGGLSVGMGGDIGTGSAEGGQVSFGVDTDNGGINSAAIATGHGGFGGGLSVGIDICWTELKCEEKCQK